MDGGLLGPGEQHVLCHPELAGLHPGRCDETGGLVFNGDDVVILSCDGQPLDVIGTLGERPLAGFWGEGVVTTLNRTLRRRCDVARGDATADDPFDPAVEWEGFPQDTVDGLGEHPCP